MQEKEDQLADMHSENSHIKAKADFIQERHDEIDIELMFLKVRHDELQVELKIRDDTIEKLLKDLEDSTQQLQELKAAIAAEPPRSPTLDAAHEEEIENLNARISALEEELDAAKLKLEQERIKAEQMAEQMAEQHSTEVVTLREEFEALANEKEITETKLQSTVTRCEEELDAAKLKLEKESIKAEQMAKQHSTEVVTLRTEFDTLANEKKITETKLQSTVTRCEEELNTTKLHLEQETIKAEQITQQHGTEFVTLKENFEALANEKKVTETQLQSAVTRFQEMELLVKKLKIELIESKGNFRSWLRIRPPQGALIKQPITIHGDDKVEVLDRHGSVRTFNFDRVFAPEADNNSVFQDLSEILEAALQGYDITVLAYGQTGSGKTYTMSAMLDMALEQIFSQLTKSYGTEYSVKGRCIEVYEQKVYDLFNQVREQQKVSTDCGGLWPSREGVLQVHTADLDSVNSVQEMLKKVNRNRSSGQTEKNDTSSRSHMFISFNVKASRIEKSGAVTTTRSGITFVDLAGSESLKNVTGRLSETQAINAELSALRSVLIAMGSNQPRIPFRDTQLTRLLQDGFTGGKVLFIQAASIGELEESIHTMDFGGLVSKVTQKKPSKNVKTEFAATEVEEPTTPTPKSAGSASTRNTPKGRGTPVSRGGTPVSRGGRGRGQ